MRRTTVVPLAILIFVVVMAIVGFRFYQHTEFTRLGSVQKVIDQPSALYARMTISYEKGPIYQEEWNMSDVEGVSTYSYAIRTYAGKQISISQKTPHAMTDVSYFFGRLVQDGVWELTNKAPRGDASPRYTVYVKQLADFKQGDRTVTFTDPHYWATTAGRQFQIDLRKTNPKDLLKLSSSALADPRYQQIVEDFRAFGPPEFHTRIAAARVQAGAAK